MKKIIVIFLALLTAFLIVSCAKTEFTVSLISGTGGAYDGGYNQNAWEAVSQFGIDNDIKTTLCDSFNENVRQSYFNTTDEQKSGLIIAMGEESYDDVVAHAKENKKTSYALMDGTGESGKNVTMISFRQEETAFMAGYLAAKLTKTGKVGFIGGVESETISIFENGFKAGVVYASNDTQCETDYVGSFSEPTIGKDKANAMMDKGIDVIYHAAGQSGAGIIDTVKDNGKYVIGVDSDQSNLAPNNVCASTVKDTAKAASDICAKAMENHPKVIGGEEVSYGLAEGGVYMIYNDGIVSESLKKELEEIQNKIISGEIKVPETKEELNAFSK